MTVEQKRNDIYKEKLKYLEKDLAEWPEHETRSRGMMPVIVAFAITRPKLALQSNVKKSE